MELILHATDIPPTQSYCYIGVRNGLYLPRLPPVLMLQIADKQRYRHMQSAVRATVTQHTLIDRSRLPAPTLHLFPRPLLQFPMQRAPQPTLLLMQRSITTWHQPQSRIWVMASMDRRLVIYDLKAERERERR